MPRCNRRQAPIGQAALDIAVQPVSKPILCSPLVESDKHWVYDNDGAAPAGYL
jgi:hypothetical protein